MTVAQSPGGGSRLLLQSPPLRLIALFKLSKAVLCLGAGLGALQFLHRDLAASLAGWLDALATRFDLGAAHRLSRVAGSLSPQRLELLALAAFLYAALFTVEGVGLWGARRWAGHLTILTTLLLVPFEVYALSQHVSATRIVALLLNLLGAGYLIHNVRRSGSHAA